MIGSLDVVVLVFLLLIVSLLFGLKWLLIWLSRRIQGWLR